MAFSFDVKIAFDFTLPKFVSQSTASEDSVTILSQPTAHVQTKISDLAISGSNNAQTVLVASICFYISYCFRPKKMVVTKVFFCNKIALRWLF